MTPAPSVTPWHSGSPVFVGPDIPTLQTCPDIHVGKLWADQTANVTKRCTSISPITFISIEGSGTYAPIGADYLVGTADADLTGEIVVGATPGGELGGTWAAPTVDTTHSGSTHANLPSGAQVNAVDIVTTSGTQTLTNKSIAASQLTGIIADARMPDLTGDVTTVEGAVATTIANAAVTLAKMANLAQDLFIGRVTASTGVPETATITAAARTVLDDTTVAAMVDTLGGATSTGTGGIARATSPTLVTPALGTPASGVMTNVTGLPTAGLVDGAVTLAKMANLAQDLFIGRTTASTGVPETATITAAARTVLDDTTVGAMVDTLGGAAATGTGGLARATSPTFVTPALGTPASGVMTNVTGLPTAGLVDGAVTNAKAADMANATIKGRTTAGTGDPEDLTTLPFTLPVAQGGTGATTLTDGGILLGSGTGAITALGVAANGQIPIGDGTTDPVLATLTEGSNITITNGAGTITIAATGGGATSVFTRFITPGADTWTKGTGLPGLYVESISGGGGGGGGWGGAIGTGRPGGGGGGGGSRTSRMMPAATAAATVAITVGAGGVGGAGGSSGAGVDGAAGGTSSFGAHLSAYGGGFGNGDGLASAGQAGGGGGGSGAVGANGAATTGGTGGGPGGSTAGLANGGGGGGGGGDGGGAGNNTGGPASYGGGGGGGSDSSGPGYAGGGSVHGGGGGGGGGSTGTNNNEYGGGAGGAAPGATTGGGGAGGAAGAGAGTAGAATSEYAGSGGGGGGSSNSVTGGAGGAGGAPGGGGGGGGGGTTVGGAGGNGGRGEVRVWEF